MAVDDVLKTLGYKHSVTVMETLRDLHRFTDIEEETGLNPNVVNMSLKDLRMASLAEKQEGKYFLTERGRKALNLAQKLRKL